MNCKDIDILESVVDNRPENLFLVSTELLLEYVRDEDNPRDIRRTLIAELVARWCLSDNSDVDGLLQSLLPDWNKFVDWYKVDQLWTIDRTLPETTGNWRDPVGLAGLEACVRLRLKRLFRVDGFIPVYSPAVSDSGQFIPFELVPSPGAESWMCWADGSSCADWNSEAKKVLSDTGFQCRLQMMPEPGRSPAGASLMLPLQMALWRKTANNDFPKYDVLRVLATGRIDQGRLAAVGTRQKLEAMRRQFHRGVAMIGPDVPGEIDHGERGYVRFDIGTHMEEIRETLKSLLEKSGLAHITKRYALSRLPDLKANVDRLNRARWCDVANHLLAMKEMLRERDTRVYLEYLSLASVALCHAGRTEESRAANREAYDLAMANGMEAHALLLQIENMVDAQDMANIEEFTTLRKDVDERLARFQGPERDDLLMRFHGTMAQANCWGVLLGVEGYSKDAAFVHAQQAVAHAQDIAGALPPAATEEQYDKAESDVQQDLNYRHLCSAILEPGSPAEVKAYASARRHLDEISTKSRQNNLRFLRHQKSLALFNAWRECATLPTADELSSATVPQTDTEAWLLAANRSHLGVLFAANGDVAKSELAFDEGNEALPLAACWASVLGAIRLVLLVRAALVMRQFGKTAKSDSFARLARETNERFGYSKLFQLMKVEEWLRAMDAGDAVQTLPSFYY